MPAIGYAYISHIPRPCGRRETQPGYEANLYLALSSCSGGGSNLRHNIQSHAMHGLAILKTVLRYFIGVLLLQYGHR